MFGRLGQRIVEGERNWRRSFGKDITDPRERAWSRFHFEMLDHAILRRVWTNFGEVAPGVYRSNHPGHRRLERYRDMGIRTILSLRGAPLTSHRLFEVESCEALGLTLVATELHARKPASRENLSRLFDLFRSVERPFLMHCKSGADRAGLASALYLLSQEGASVDEARTMLSPRFWHYKSGPTGVLDHMLDLYEARLRQGPIGIEDWIATEYDPDAVAESYARRQTAR